MTIKKLLLTTTAICGAACFAHNANATTVSTADELFAAIKNGGEIEITNDISDIQVSPSYNRYHSPYISISSSSDNKFTLSGKGEAGDTGNHMFWVGASEEFDLSINNLIFENFYHSDAGYDAETGEMLWTDCGGGTIFSTGAKNTTIKNSIFRNNSSDNGGGVAGSFFLGALSIKSITDSLFEGNTARTGGGGALDIGLLGEGLGEIKNSQFIGNTALRGAGGAIASFGSATGMFSGNGTIAENVLFERNKAKNGGAIYGGTIPLSALGGDDSKIGLVDSITKTTFKANEATENGGAVNFTSEVGTFSAKFVDNKAGKNGGALYNTFLGELFGTAAETYRIAGKIDTLSATFENNSAGEHGGAIYNLGDINFVADARDSSDDLVDHITMNGNYVLSDPSDTNSEKLYEAIYNAGNFSFVANNGGGFTFYDYIVNDNTSVTIDEDTYNLFGKLTFAGDGSGKFNLFNDIKGNGEITFDAAYDFNMINNAINTVEASKININAGSALSLDADLSGIGAIDRFVGAVNMSDGEDVLFTIKSLNFLNDFDENVAGLRLAVADGNILKENSEEKTLVTSGGTYTYSNDKQNINITKTGDEGGFSKFVAGMINLPDDRAYSFTEDEEMKLVYGNGSNMTGIVGGGAANLTVNGNNKVLTAVKDNSDKFGKALSLASAQKAAVNNLTFKGFDEAISNAGELTLNNVNITDSKAGLVINEDNTINISGETTFSGNDNDILSNVTGGGSQYPIFGTYLNFDIMSSAIDDGLTYDEYMAQLSEEISNEVGETIVVRNMDEYIEAVLHYEIGSQNVSDYGLITNSEFGMGVELSEDDYNSYLNAIKNAATDLERYAYTMLILGGKSFEEAQSAIASLTDEDKANIQAGIDSAYQAGMPELSTAFAGGYATQTLMMADNSVVNFNSKISGADAFGLNLSGAENSLVNLGENAIVENADLVLDGPILKIANEDTNLANVNSFEAKSGTIDMTNGAARRLVANNLKITGDIKLFVDVDLAQKVMDNLGDLDENTTIGKVIVDKMILLNDAEESTTNIAFTNTAKDKVDTTVSSAETLKYRYAVEYDKETGEFKFVKSDKNSSQQIAESVGVPSISVGVQQTQSALNSLLANRDIYIGSGLSSGDPARATTWAKAFGSKDSVELKHSYNSIDTQFYGVVGGVDSRTFIYDNGVNAVYGIYAAYMGSNQKQNSVKVTQDGGYLGVSADLTKNGVFSRFTAHGGYIANEAKTAWGNDKFDIWTASVSNKTGYEIDFGEYTLKPALYASYMYINTENYTSKAGAKLKNHTKNVFEVTPEVKLAKDFGTGLEGYAKVAYTWNFYQGGKVTADDVLLPKMSVKPYVEYGVGLEKDWSEEEWNPKDITSYAEINRHDGGRTGWDINAGLKFQF